jgi:hypothetical protein
MPIPGGSLEAVMTISKRAKVGVLAAVVAVPLGFVGLASATAAGSTVPGGQHQTIPVLVTENPPVHLLDEEPRDNPSTQEPEFSAGDTILFLDPVLDPETGKEIGDAVTRIQVVNNLDQDGDAPYILDCTIRLQDGNLIFFGAEQFAHMQTTSRFTVIGGTGRYAGVDGAVTATPDTVSERKGALITFELTL